MQRAFIEHDAFQCGYCTPGQIMSAVELLEEGNAATTPTSREFMSGNICRCAAYPNIRAAIRDVRDAAGERPMRPLSYARAGDVDERVAHGRRRPATARSSPAARPRSTSSALGVTRPTLLVDINALPLADVERPAGRRAADRRAGAHERRRPHPRVVERYPGDLAGAAARRVGAAAQHGVDGRQPVPADALRATSATASRRATSATRAAAARRWTGSTAATRSSARASTASPRTRPTSRSRWSRSTPSCTRSGPDGARHDPDRRLLPAARRHPGAASTRSSTAS